MSKQNENEININGVLYVKKNTVAEVDGDFVIVRTARAGVHAGVIKEQSESGMKVTLTSARRIWKWSGAASLSQLAGEGTSNPEGCKFPAAIAQITLTEVIEVIPCTNKARDLIMGVEPWVA